MTPEQAALEMGEEKLAEGVYGCIFDTPEGIYIPVITAGDPGNGDVGRFLDSLPRDRDVKFPCVISPILDGMLRRRGFVDGKEFSEEFQEDVEMLVRARTGAVR